MKPSQIIKTVVFGLVFGINFLLALGLWLCGESGNILLGILMIVLYRISLWTAPAVITVVCWLPWRPKETWRQKLLTNVILLLLCGLLFVTSFWLFGNWY